MINTSTPSGLNPVIKRFQSAFLAAGAFSFVINTLLLAPSIYMLQVYDRVLTSRNATTLLMLTLVLLGLLVLEAALEFFRSRLLVRVGVALDLQLNTRVFDAVFERRHAGGTGSAAQALSDLSQVRQFLTSQGVFAFFDAPWTPIYLVVIFLLSPWIGVFALAGALLLLCMAVATERFTAPLLTQASQAAASATALAASHLRHGEVIAAMGMRGPLRERWVARQTSYLALQAQASDRAAAIGALTRFTRLAMQSGILGLGAYLVLDNQLTPGGMIAASILLGRALAPVELGISTWRGFVSTRGAYARLSALLNEHPAPAPALTLPKPTGEVRAERLVVALRAGQPPILKGIGFHAPAGALVAVVGPSGSGKSTLARALVGNVKPQAGTLRLDGADIHTWDKALLGPCIGYLPQEVELLDGTVAQNIARFGMVDDQAVVRAAQMAGVHELILRLPQGYDTPLGEGGVVLSAGQSQRVGLARALYGNATLVVLDEPNSNLDEAGDAALMHALRELRTTRRTVFVVTHRRNVLDVADRILVLMDGAIQNYGPRDAVLGAKPAPDPARMITNA
jgi:PrtD family type I secretion system ABC transporter